jgi:hypothetical protein
VRIAPEGSVAEGDGAAGLDGITTNAANATGPTTATGRATAAARSLILVVACAWHRHEVAKPSAHVVLSGVVTMNSHAIT